jgi:hypothetical protein
MATPQLLQYRHYTHLALRWALECNGLLMTINCRVQPQSQNVETVEDECTLSTLYVPDTARSCAAERTNK